MLEMHSLRSEEVGLVGISPFIQSQYHYQVAYAHIYEVAYAHIIHTVWIA